MLAGIIVLINIHRNSIHWQETYLPDDVNPYGTKIIFELLQHARQGQTFVKVKDSISKKLPDISIDNKDSYVYIGLDYHADSADVASLLQFVSKGNNAFIICSNQDHLLLDSLTMISNSNQEDIELDDDEVWVDHEDIHSTQQNTYSVEDTSISLHLTDVKRILNPTTIKYKNNFKTSIHSWNYFSDRLRTLEEAPVEILGSFDENYVNFIKLRFGKGEFYFHSTPMSFTNIHMLNDTTMHYCREALSSIGDGTIFWDEENRNYDWKAASQSNRELHKPEEGPLEFILSEPSLRKAWYLLMLAAILYLIFGAKRKQRVLRTMTIQQNTSIEYAEVISRMFLNQKDHKKLILMKMDLLKSHIRDRFNVRLPIQMKDETDVLYLEISQKSAVPFDQVKSIFEKHKYLASIVFVGTSEMVSFHKEIEAFYETCK